MTSLALRNFGLKILILLLSLIVFIDSHASGGDDDDRGLSGQHSPDFPLKSYVSGHLGVISPKYRLSYLIIAYRYLSHHPLSAQEQRHVLDSFATYFSDLFFAEDGFRVDLNQSNAEIARLTYQTYPYYAEQPLSRWWKKSKKRSLAQRVAMLTQGYPHPVKSFTKYQLAGQRLKAIADELAATTLPEEKNVTFCKAGWMPRIWCLTASRMETQSVKPLTKFRSTTSLSCNLTHTIYMP